MARNPELTKQEKEDAAKLTEEQVRKAREIVDRVFNGDTRGTDGALVGAVLGAIVANYARMKTPGD